MLIVDRRSDILEKNRYTYDIEVFKLPVKYEKASDYELMNGITDREHNRTFGYKVILERLFSKHMYCNATAKNDRDYIYNLYPDNKTMDKAVLETLDQILKENIHIDIVRFNAFRYVPKAEEKRFYAMDYKDRKDKTLPHKTRYEKELKAFCEKAKVKYPFE